MNSNEKISVVITSFKEPKTVDKAIQNFSTQSIKPYEILVLAPDKETIEAAEKYAKKYPLIRVIRDSGKGKPAALNYARKLIKGEIVILSDGDVFVEKESINKLVTHFKNKSVGAVTGRVIAINKENNIFGYWAQLTTEAFHQRRILGTKNNENILCSGYLYAIRKNLMPKIPVSTLADDAYVSEYISRKRYKTTYEPQAKVFVKYPDNVIDWIKQKKRTAARIYQPLGKSKNSKMKAFIEEIITGARVLAKVNSVKKIYWFGCLLVMRSYIWFRVLFDYRLWNRGFARTWERVESTK